MAHTVKHLNERSMDPRWGSLRPWSRGFSRASSCQTVSKKIPLLSISLGWSYHGLWVYDMAYTHPLDLFGRQKTELNLLDRAQGRTRVLKK